MTLCGAVHSGPGEAFEASCAALLPLGLTQIPILVKIQEIPIWDQMSKISAHHQEQHSGRDVEDEG